MNDLKPIGEALYAAKKEFSFCDGSSNGTAGDMVRKALKHLKAIESQPMSSDQKALEIVLDQYRQVGIEEAIRLYDSLKERRSTTESVVDAEVDMARLIRALKLRFDIPSHWSVGDETLANHKAVLELYLKDATQ